MRTVNEEESDGVAPAVLCLLLAVTPVVAVVVLMAVVTGGGGDLVTVLVVLRAAGTEVTNAFLAGPEPWTPHLNLITSPFPFYKVKVITP